MNEVIANYLAQHYATLNIVSRSAGCVSELALKEGKSVPSSPLIYQETLEGVQLCDIDADYKKLVPQSTEKGILFFESVKGSTARKESSRMLRWTGYLNLVFWANTKKIGENHSLVSLQSQIMQHLPDEIPGNALGFLKGRVHTAREMPKDYNPFAKYNFDDPAYQVSPYLYFVYEIRYEALTTRNCNTALILNPSEC